MVGIKKDYYKILGVEKKASLSEIKKAFRRKAKRIHPDTGIHNKRSEPAVRELITAYQILSNKQSRKEYDKACVRQREVTFNYREFLVERKDDLNSQAKLIFFDLLHKNESAAVELYKTLLYNDLFSLEQQLGVEDFMDCAYLLCEEFEKKHDFISVFNLLYRISELEHRQNYFKHFIKDVQIKMKDVVCKKIQGKVPPAVHIELIEQVMVLPVFEKERPVYLKKMAEIYTEMGKKGKARYYLKQCLDLKPGLSGVENLRKKLACY